MDENNALERFAKQEELSIFVTEADRTGMDIWAMSDFTTNRMNRLASLMIERVLQPVVQISPADIALAEQALRSGKHIVQGDYEYILDFDSLPKDVLRKFREGKYRLGESRQVKDNLRAVIVDEQGTRVKDLTLKREKRTIATADYMQNIAIQAQLRQINLKLDHIIELQGYQIDFSRDTTLVAPFFSARDRVVHAQNEADPNRRRGYLDEAVGKIEEAMNNAYLDIKRVEKLFLHLTRLSWMPFCEGRINQYIGYIAQDIALLRKH